ncbi:MAG: UDP-glucose/GDP-mannose dehydrogenase family protein, partial [Xanthomonadales bacterium]|nr:UDP-glucose/GDP-mannose dehydrogenase family protein [Xanthomonadales bacterium]
MRISVIGTGYVGLVTGTCLAEAGNHVLCMDTDLDKVERLRAGDVPIFEPGLEELVHNNLEHGRLAFTDSLDEVAEITDVVFITVGTPQGDDGAADLRQILGVATGLGERLERDTLLVVKSTVPVGSCRAVADAVQAALDERGSELTVRVASNPEFLKEGAAVADFMKPDRIVIGVADREAETLLRRLYQPFNRNHEKLLVMDIPSAEFTKYAANAMLASRISMMNEFAQIADRLGVDIEQVRTGIGADPRIGKDFLYPGIGYGGSCFPKDVKALRETARAAGYEARMLGAIEAVNEDQKRHLLELVTQEFGTDLDGRVFALWGLAFKPNTDDMREAPSRTLIDGLLQRGAVVRAHDPVALDTAARLYSDTPGVSLHEDEYEALDGADALLIATEWKSFWTPDFRRLADALGERTIFDGRNI